MPHRTRAEERIDEIDISPTKLLADIDQLRNELQATTAKADEYLAGLQRERAEFSNYRRRTSEEREAMLGLAGEDLLRKVIAIADDFDLAIENRPAELAGSSWVEGVTAIDRKLRALLESEGVRPVEAEPGKPFDPRSGARHSPHIAIDPRIQPRGLEIAGNYHYGVIRPIVVRMELLNVRQERGIQIGDRPDNASAIRVHGE